MNDPFLSDAPKRSTGADFEALPYSSHPFPDTRPAHLAMIAALLGFECARPNKARVLELGCASGGNLIPMAVQSPEGRFLGVDLSRRHVELGSERIAALGLENVEIRQGDLGEADLIEGEWDFIICHGVYSWVSQEVQAQIMRTCRAALSANGLAYISYNVLPGWQQRKVVRDIFLLGDDPSQSASDRVARGRWLLEELAGSTEEDSHYGAMLRAEAASLAKQPDNYIMAEFLVDENLPCYFRDFAGRAADAGLGFLGETRLGLNALEVMNPQLDAKLRTLAGPSREMYEQYYDFLTGRAFRQSVLYRKDAHPGFKRKLEAAPLTGMHFAADLAVKTVEDKPDTWRIEMPGGRGFTTNDPAVVGMFTLLKARHPGTATPRQILEHLAQDASLDRTNLSERVMSALMRTVLVGLVTPLMASVNCGSGRAERPAIWQLALQEIASGKGWMTNQAHRPVRVDKLGLRLAVFVDGTRTRAEIEAEVAKVLDSEGDTLGLFSLDGPATYDARQMTETLITQYAKLGLLEAD